MEAFRLDPDTLLPTDLIENYSSLIWAERHYADGTFELKTAKVAETKVFLPEDTLITHLDTDEVMKVETHSISKDENNNEELLITGRVVKPTLLENRAMIGYEYGKEWNTYQYYTASEVISAILWNLLANNSGNDILLGAGWINTAVKVPNLVITDSALTSDAARIWFFSDGPAEPKVKELLENNGLSIRSIRPSKYSNGNVVSFNTTTNSASRGLRTVTPSAAIEQLRLDIYKGVDRTREQLGESAVVFSYELGDIDDPSYLFSVKDFKNMVVARSSQSTREIWAETGTTAEPAVVPIGEDLRILYFDGGSPDATAPDPPTFEDPIPYPTDALPSQMAKIDAQNAQLADQNAQRQAVYDNAVIEYNNRLADFEIEVAQKALDELRKHNRAIIFDGAISATTTKQYRNHYFLGDKVTLEAEYGVEQTMIVSEFVRTEDKSGDRGYPTLILAE